MPRTNWLLVNRLDLSAFFQARGRRRRRTKKMMLEAALTAPPDERLKRIVAYVKTYHLPRASEERDRRVFARRQRSPASARPNDGEQEYLIDWMFDMLISWETGLRRAGQPAGRGAPGRQRRGRGDRCRGSRRPTARLRAQGVPLLVFLAPVGSVDPDYADFWRPWPRAYSWNYICDECTSRLAAALRKARSASSICARTSPASPAPIASSMATGARKAKPSSPTGYDGNCR